MQTTTTSDTNELLNKLLAAIENLPGNETTGTPANAEIRSCRVKRSEERKRFRAIIEKKWKQKYPFN